MYIYLFSLVIIYNDYLLYIYTLGYQQQSLGVTINLADDYRGNQIYCSSALDISDQPLWVIEPFTPDICVKLVEMSVLFSIFLFALNEYQVRDG